MLISSTTPGTETDANGNALLTSFLMYDAHAPGRSLGVFGSRAAEYRGYHEDGTSPDGDASWISQGPFPEEPIVYLTESELVIAYPDEASLARISVWGLYPRILRPSATLGGPEETLELRWTPDPTPFSVRGFFGESTTLFNQVRVGSGAVWVLTANAVTCLDFARDHAVLYQNTKGVLSPGELSAGSAPDYPFTETPSTDLSLPLYPYTSLELYSSGMKAYAVVGGGDGVGVLVQDFTAAGSPYQVLDVAHLGFAVTDVGVMPDGRVLAVGRETDPLDDSPGRLCWAVRVPVTADVYGDTAWSAVNIGPQKLLGIRAGVTLGPGGRPWIWFDRGIFRFQDTYSALTGDSNLVFWAGIRGDDIGVEPRFASLDRCDVIAGFVFDRGMPAVLHTLTVAQNGGSLLSIFDRQLKQVLYRRRYKDVRLGLGASLARYPDSPSIIPGKTLSPPVGYGPDQVSPR